MAKEVKFSGKLNIDGKESLVAAEQGARKFAEQLGFAKNKSDKLYQSVFRFNQLSLSFQNLQNGLQSITGVLNSLTEESRSFGAAMKAANTMAGKDAAGFEQLKDQVTELSKL